MRNLLNFMTLFFFVLNVYSQKSMLFNYQSKETFTLKIDEQLKLAQLLIQSKYDHYEIVTFIILDNRLMEEVLF